MDLSFNILLVFAGATFAVAWLLHLVFRDKEVLMKAISTRGYHPQRIALDILRRDDGMYRLVFTISGHTYLYDFFHPSDAICMLGRHAHDPRIPLSGWEAGQIAGLVRQWCSAASESRSMELMD